MLQIEKYSIGIGDRFARQGKAQLQAFVKAKALGVDIVPVWNKSHREHTIVGTSPDDVRKEADAAVAALDWTGSYYVDADHIGLGNVDGFIGASDFFTLDVADAIGTAAPPEDVRAFADKWSTYTGHLSIPGLDEALHVTREDIEAIARKFLLAVQEAGRTYRHIVDKKGGGNFVTEVSMDETDGPQSPKEMLFILAAISDEGIPAQTIAPKFTGEFYKGIDYVGDAAAFEKEFNEDLAVIAFAVREFGLPANLKLSVHSGSDKFSLYPIMSKALKRFDVGLHLKTAGTTWLEELIGLAESGDDGLEVAKEVYRQALARYDELCGPYAAVIDIDRKRLPAAEAVARWDGNHYARVLRHDQACPDFNVHFRQMLHVAYKVAAEMGERYYAALERHEESVAANVTANIYERHVKPLFLG